VPSLNKQGRVLTSQDKLAKVTRALQVLVCSGYDGRFEVVFRQGHPSTCHLSGPFLLGDPDQPIPLSDFGRQDRLKLELDSAVAMVRALTNAGYSGRLEFEFHEGRPTTMRVEQSIRVADVDPASPLARLARQLTAPEFAHA
jgi:hypothetical protein